MSLKCATIGGVVVASLDVILGLFILSFYGKIQHDRFHCAWSHGIRHCDYFIYDSNHSTRTIVGIICGIISLIFSGLLMLAFLKRIPALAWAWLGKALVLIGVNAYFIAGWMYRQSWQFHNYYHPNEKDEDMYFLLGGVVELVFQLLLAFGFCASVVPLTMGLRKRRKAEEAAETPI